VPKLFLPDNTVLINFAIIRRMDLLAELLKGQGAWCISIARECRNSQAYHPDLDKAGAIFGPPLIPDAAERIDATILREAMASPGEASTQHLGEAETIAIISARRLDGLFLTDDGGAAALARRHQITAVSTWDLLRLAHKSNKVTRPVLTGYLRTLKGAGRGQPRNITSLDDLTPWLPEPE
jgi:predicted nucleic acid-binding protein